MINISMPSNVIQNNIISTDFNNAKVNDGKKSYFLNLLSSLTSNKNGNNKSTELNTNNIYQNAISLILDEDIQTKTIDEGNSSSNLNLNNEEDVDTNNQNGIVEISNAVNLFLLNNKQINDIKDLKSDINNLQNEIKVKFTNTNKPYSNTTNALTEISDFKSNIKETEFNVEEQNNVIIQNQNIEKINNRVSINDLNLNNVKFNSINLTEYKQNRILSENKLLNINGIQDPNMTIKIANSNFDTRLQTFLKENNLTTYKQQNNALNNVQDSTNVSISNSDVASDLNISSMKNSFEIIDNLSLKADNFSEYFDKSKIVENETNSTLNNSITNINSFDKVIEITDESNKLNSAVMAQVKDKVNLMYNEKTSQVTMQLTPENLGKIDIKMSFGEDSLKLEITTFNEETNKILNSSVSDLISTLKSNSEKPVEVILKSGISHNDKHFNYNQANENNDQNYQNQKQRKNKYYYDNKFADDEEKNGVFEKLINGLS